MTPAFRKLAIAFGGAALALAHASAVARDQPGAARALVVDHVVIVMRHGVRPPTKAPAMPAGYARGDWPEWSVPPGWLTPHGAEAVTRIGAWDAERLRVQRLLPARGCPAKGTVRVVADSDERTIATADAWLAALAPHCGLVTEHRAQDEFDPRFGAIEAKLAPFDPAKADAAVLAAAGPGGIAAVEARYRPLLGRIDAVLCGPSHTACGVSREPSGVKPAGPDARPKLTGALDRASTAAQILLLEYADGKPMREVGWGRANAKDIGDFSAFHALEFRLLARPHAIARVNFAGLAPVIREGLTGTARVTMISGHDTNVANLGGLLSAHWRVPGLAADDPSPGGAIVLTALHDAAGRRFVRVEYRSQSLEQIRTARPLAPRDAYAAVLTLEGCAAGTLCTMDEMGALIGW